LWLRGVGTAAWFPSMSSPTRRLRFVAAFVVVVAAVLAAAAYAYDNSRSDVIARGVTIGGVDVGGLTVAEARARVQARLVQPLGRPVTVTAPGHVWQLTSLDAAVTVNTDALVAQALRASRHGSLFTRVVRGLRNGAVAHDVPVPISFSHAAVRAFDARIRTALDRDPRDATVTPGASGPRVSPSVAGLKVNSDVLGRDVEHALLGRLPSRTLVAPTDQVQPQVSSTQLAAEYPAYIVVNRGSFKLDLYQNLKLTRSYEIAVGMQGLETPAGLYHIQWKQVNPSWYVPHSSWTGKLAGKVIPPGPQDPLKARYMAFDGGAGIHGIDPSEYGTIGHDASHGCVRMRIPDVIDLYSKTPVGTPVYVV
jgi:lipoprotein-anchoring transpeptidase ErfK/SrfK